MNRYGWLDEFLLRNPGAVKDYKSEWQWHRYMVDGKMFAATCQPGPQYKPHNCREMVILKCDPILAELLRDQYPDIIPGFYMDKRNWNSVYLDGDVPDGLMRDMCDSAYRLVFSKLTKKAQAEILEKAGDSKPGA